MENTNQAKEIWQDYQILDEIARDRNVSQRDLARNSGLALGRTNQVVKRLIRKGLVKTSQINAKRVAYYLTPKGFSEKLRLVVEYARITVSLFSMVRQVINRSLAGLVETHNVRTVVIYGTGELAEAAYLSIQEIGLELASVYDMRSGKDTWLGRRIRKLPEIQPEPFDVVMITEIDDLAPTEKQARELGVHVLEIRELLSDHMARFAKRISDDDPHRERVSLAKE